MTIALRYAARSDIGLGRYSNNQDSGYAGPNLLVVADGMGGHAGGDIASSIAVGELAHLDGEAHGSDALQHLQQAIHEAHARMHQAVDSEPSLGGMGTTVTALLFTGRRLALAHIGDSRAYLLSDNGLQQVTRDHTFVQWLIDEGRISPEEAEQHPQRSVVMKVLGDVEANDEPDTSVREARVGDRWLLCSDGLSNFVSDETLEATLREVRDPGGCADQLVQLALRSGGQDNITCIVADVVDAASAPPSAPQVVGSAAVDRHRPSVATGSPAAKAAALSRSVGDANNGTEDDEPAEPPRRRRWGRALATLAVLAVLVPGGNAGYAWSQNQYYVGVDRDDVAIYRGLSQDVGPVALSTVFERQDIPVESLPEAWRNRVDAGIEADDLPHARAIVVTLLQRSTICEAAEPTPTATTTAPTTTAPTTTAPTTAATGMPATSTPTTSPTTPTTGPTTSPADTPTSRPTNSAGDPLPAGCTG